MSKNKVQNFSLEEIICNRLILKAALITVQKKIYIMKCNPSTVRDQIQKFKAYNRTESAIKSILSKLENTSLSFDKNEPKEKKSWSQRFFQKNNP